MKNTFPSLAIGTVLALAFSAAWQKSSAQSDHPQAPSPTTGPAETKPDNEKDFPAHVTEIPPDYRDWKLISVAREEGSQDDIRAVLGNDVAIKAYREKAAVFPDGAIIVRIAWSYVSSEDNNRAFGQPQSHVAGTPKNGVQFMVKDAVKYAATGGWGYGQFNDGKSIGGAKLKSCYPCHQAIESRDFVFTRYAP